jgi:hypothetical protein
LENEEKKWLWGPGKGGETKCLEIIERRRRSTGNLEM